ncbi:MAG: sugar kinase [Syntrophobacteraceae bacterium]|nr:sugar kinase [Syntrophobacteraceae bacterium]
MSWLIVGTIPREDFPLYEGPCRFADGRLHLDGHILPIARGTPALLAAACITSRILGIEPPRTLLGGDIGRGEGSIQVYQHLAKNLPVLSPELLVYHYLLPDVDWHNRVYLNIEELEKRPLLVADAGYMYAAKMSGFASGYDLFTPDAGELAFLADERAPHPFYTRGFLLQEEERVPDLIRRAYEHEDASRYLLVKGRCDVVASREGILDEIGDPCVECLEPVGGTGDSLTGIVGALIAGKYPIHRACSLAARINRVMGRLAGATPACSIERLLRFLPEAIDHVSMGSTKGIG